MPNRAHVTDGPGTESRHAGIFALGESVVYPNDGPFDWISLAKSKVPFLTHCPIDKEFIARCHGLGIRCLPYVQFYMGGAQVTLVNDTSDSYEGVRWADHADWYAFDPSGDPRPSEYSKDGVDIVLAEPLLVCCNVEAYRRAMVAWTGYIMEHGADGVFVDVILRADACYGEQRGIHKHIIPDSPRTFRYRTPTLGRTRTWRSACYLKRSARPSSSTRLTGLFGEIRVTRSAFPLLNKSTRHYQSWSRHSMAT